MSSSILEEDGARWPHRSSKPAWRLIQSPEGSTPSPLRHQISCFRCFMGHEDCEEIDCGIAHAEYMRYAAGGFVRASKDRVTAESVDNVLE
jgi:hypothetical protein